MAGRILVFIACSLDGFIAGPGDDLSWLPGPSPDGGDFGYGEFMAGVGALLMGRNTYEVVAAFSAPAATAPAADATEVSAPTAAPPTSAWPYGDLPVLVATHRALAPKVSTVRAVSGDAVSLATQAREAAGEKDVYVDGGVMIRALLNARLVDEMTVTLIPVILGDGVPLFAGLKERCGLERLGVVAGSGGLIQVTYRPL